MADAANIALISSQIHLLLLERIEGNDLAYIMEERCDDEVVTGICYVCLVIVF